MRRFFSIFGAAAMFGLAGCGGDDAPAQDPKVVAGAQAFVKYACAQCHGLDGAGKTFAASDGNRTVPSLKTYTKQSDMAIIDGYIKGGKGVMMNLPAGTLFMPVWTGIVSADEITAIENFIVGGMPAVSGVSLPMISGTDAAAGKKVYNAYGCGSCHGVDGVGGIANPGSEDGTIPALRGMDFRGEFDTAEKISTMIREGAVIGNPPVVDMPSWDGILSDDELTAVVAYIQSLPAE